jgi:hypothetical protein
MFFLQFLLDDRRIRIHISDKWIQIRNTAFVTFDLSFRAASLGNEEITPLLPPGIGERYSKTISNLGHAALLRRCGLRL